MSEYTKYAQPPSSTLTFGMSCNNPPVTPPPPIHHQSLARVRVYSSQPVPSRGASARLTREEKNTLITHMKTLKSVVKIRDEYTQTKTATKVADNIAHASFDPYISPYHTEELRRSHQLDGF